jgi:pimeloyl-ACP methyl ester carboxylesterase
VTLRLEQVELHGHRVFFRIGGDGPAIVLIHGITGTSETWSGVLPALARDYTVLAPDLLGHGESAKPRGDYSLGAYASGVRDLTIALDIDRPPTSGTRSAAASRCSSPTSSRTGSTAWCSSRAAVSAPRST